MIHIKSKNKSRQRGFALVCTLLLMTLLAVLVIALLGVSGTEMRKAGRGAELHRARANARLALTIAIGEMQKNLGPDQRVTADSSLFADSVAGGGVEQPRWVNVWRTTRADGSSLIVRDGEDGGLRDTREGSGWNSEVERVTTLVSGNEQELTYFMGRGESHVGDSLVQMVGPGSSDDAPVLAPQVALDEGKGAYAWWVGDLGMRANIATRDGTRESSASTADLRALMLTQDASLKAIAGEQGLENSVRSKLASLGQIDRAASDSGLSLRTFHDYTTESLGLAVNVRDGGLQSDLTAFLESNGNVPDLTASGVRLSGLRDPDNLVGPATPAADAGSGSPGQADRFLKISPNFGLLRDWANRSANSRLGDLTKNAEYAQTTGEAINGRNQFPVAIENRSRTDLTPVLVEASIYYNLSCYEHPQENLRNPYGMRLHLYPRVVLWNPYNFDLKLDPSMIFLHINGKKQIEVRLAGGRVQSYNMHWGLPSESQQGSLFFKLEGATLGPGESLMWSPAQNSPYHESDFSKNLLAPDVAPDPSRALYQDSREDGPIFRVQQTRPLNPNLANDRLPAIPIEWREFVPSLPGGNIQAAGYTQADDYLVLWKPLRGVSGPVGLGRFNSLPQGKFISCAYQYGDEDELPVEWSDQDPVPFLVSSMADPAVYVPPDRRTRDGFRLRWFDEHSSNRLGSGSLAGTAHFDSAPIANWNMRASFSLRSPYENVTDVSPHFFGIYTRDLFDGAIDWNSMAPQYSQGNYHATPFDQPVRGTARRILFDIPRSGTEVASLGAFQHVSFSELIWHPTYAFGNSLADPRVERSRTEPRRNDPSNREKGGWNQHTIGFALDGRSDPNSAAATTIQDNWAWSARKLLADIPLDQNVHFDLSYELNHHLWDGYFLSSGTAADKSAFLADSERNPLPNGRMRLIAEAGKATRSELTDFHRAASKLGVDGAFNVNSTSVTAWESLLLSNIGRQFGGETSTFPRILNAPGGEWDGNDVTSPGAWSGQRVFSRGEIRRLAEAIVDEVKLRGPFLSLADFVNRRLREDETGKVGALQAAIDRAALNQPFQTTWPLDHANSLPDYSHPDHISDPTRLEQTLKPSSTAWGALGFLTQADLLQFLGPALRARSDTFVIRAYGNATAADGRVLAEAWCEATIQRSPVPIQPDVFGLNPKVTEGIPDFGRKFHVTRFRWLKQDEV